MFVSVALLFFWDNSYNPFPHYQIKEMASESSGSIPSIPPPRKEEEKFQKSKTTITPLFIPEDVLTAHTEEMMQNPAWQILPTVDEYMRTTKKAFLYMPAPPPVKRRQSSKSNNDDPNNTNNKNKKRRVPLTSSGRPRSISGDGIFEDTQPKNPDDDDDEPSDENKQQDQHAALMSLCGPPPSFSSSSSTADLKQGPSKVFLNGDDLLVKLQKHKHQLLLKQDQSNYIIPDILCLLLLDLQLGLILRNHSICQNACIKMMLWIDSVLPKEQQQEQCQYLASLRTDLCTLVWQFFTSSQSKTSSTSSSEKRQYNKRRTRV